MSEEYFCKVKPTFDMLSEITDHLIKKGEGKLQKTLSAIFKNKKHLISFGRATQAERKHSRKNGQPSVSTHPSLNDQT
jgi:hypothetical protein